VFPVSNLSVFFPPNQIVCGYSQPADLYIDLPAMAEVNVHLTSDDPVVIVPPVVTFQVGQTFTEVTIQTAPIAGPFATKSVHVHATYAGKTLTISVEVVPPSVESVVFQPESVVAGNESTGTVSLNFPSLLGTVAINLIDASPGFATLQGPPPIIPANSISGTFTVSTPKFQVAFPTAQAAIVATYGASFAKGVLTVTSSVVAGILSSLTVSPSTTVGGETIIGTVRLVEAVPVDTLVGLAAITQGGVVMPLPTNISAVASVPSSLTIHAGQTGATFRITTRRPPPGTSQKATIVAGAVVTKYVGITVEG